MNRLAPLLALLLIALVGCVAAGPRYCPAGLPVYDHVVIVVEENKDYEQIVGNPAAPYLNRLAAEGALLTQMFGEEHNSEGNYFWLFSGDNQGVGFDDKIPSAKYTSNNLGAALIAKGLSFKGYSEGLPAIGSEIGVTPSGCHYPCRYGRKHVPWISFANVPNGPTIATSSNLRLIDFPADYNQLPTVAFVIPDQEHDMHNGTPQEAVPAGDRWLAENLDRYYQWAKTHNSLLIVTFDENDDKGRYQGLTNPLADPSSTYPPVDQYGQLLHDLQNRIVTIFAGAHIKQGLYAEGNGI